MVMATKNYEPKRTGNEESHAGKRAAFKEAKKERSGLAGEINAAFAQAGKYKEEETSYWNKIPDLDGEIKYQGTAKRKK